MAPRFVPSYSSQEVTACFASTSVANRLAARCFLRGQKYRITKLDKEKNHYIRGKSGSREYSKGNKTVPEKVATTHTEDGHKQDT